jgi:hypothetical protein
MPNWIRSIASSKSSGSIWGKQRRLPRDGSVVQLGSAEQQIGGGLVSQGKGVVP